MQPGTYKNSFKLTFNSVTYYYDLLSGKSGLQHDVINLAIK